MVRIRLVAALSCASVLTLACADSSPDPVDPAFSVRLNHTSAGACTAAQSRTAKSELMNLLSGNPLKAAQARWAAVESACSTTNPDAANSAFMVYLDSLLVQYPAGFAAPKKGATKEGNLIGHLNTTFSFVGYAAPHLPAGAVDNGILVVITQASTTREYQKEHLGAFTLPWQTTGGDARGHLFSMYRRNDQCLSVGNLQEFGNCVEVASFPATTGFLPKIKVGICTPEGLTGSSLALGHETSGGTEIAGKDNYPENCHTSINVASTATGLERAITRLAAFGRRTFGIARAFAADKGLGGIGGALSPWGILETQIFAATFDAPNQVGSPPVGSGNFNFTQTVTAPGSILVQSSLGNLQGPLVVLSQGGGACANCGNLLLQADFFSPTSSIATTGKYQINWTSVQAAPSVKTAPFVLRGADTARVATVEYKSFSAPARNVLLYNGDSVGVWVRNVSDRFEILVDLTAKTTTLKINDAVVATAVPFQSAATGIKSLGAEFTGIDSGVMGWDEIGVVRISDQPSQ